MRILLAAAGAAILAVGLAPPAGAVPPCNIACSLVCNGPSDVQYCSTTDIPCRTVYRCFSGSSGNVPCSCGAGCFLAGTMITMADGTKKAIETIAVGDMVLAYDERTGELKPDRVSAVHEPAKAEGYLVVNKTMFLTRVHPVLTPAGWKEIGELAVGDKLIGADKTPIEIASIEVRKDPVTVYNFATNPYATYVANGVIVHNKPPIPTE